MNNLKIKSREGTGFGSDIDVFIDGEKRNNIEGLSLNLSGNRSNQAILIVAPRELDIDIEANVKTFDIEIIASLCHQVNRAYCESIGDHSQPEWNEAPEWQKQSAINGVAFHLGNETTPEQSHESWMKQKIDDGWTFGPVKDPETKEHPCLVPYDQLSVEQRTKDYLFKAICDFFK